MKKVLVGFMTGLLCVMPAAGVMAEDAAAETTNEAQAGTEETTAEGEGVQTGAQALSDDIYSFQAEIDGEVYQFPMPYGEFTAKGWTYDGDAAQTMEPEQYTAAETFKKDSSKPVSYTHLGEPGNYFGKIFLSFSRTETTYDLSLIHI